MFTFDEDTVSDLHKDAFGFRPSSYWWREWMLADDYGRQEIWDSLLVALQNAVDDEREREERCIRQFENWIATLQRHGAADRDMAIRWIAEAHDTTDREFLCYLLGLPFWYLKA